MRVLVRSLALLVLAAAPAAGAVPPPSGTAAARVIAVADSLLAAGHLRECLALADSMVHASERGGDVRIRVRALALFAGAQALTGHPERAEPAARAAMERSFASGDSAVGCRALRWLAFSYLQRNRFEQSTPLYQRLLVLAEPLGLWSDVGYAHMGIAYDALLTGRLAEARRGYRHSIAALRRAGDQPGARQASIGLARVLEALGDFDGERRMYLEMLRESHGGGDWMGEAAVNNNLGVVEYTVGDPGLAMAYWRRALALRAGRSALQASATTRTNVALALLALGRYDEAIAGLDSLLAACHAAGLRGEEVETRSRLGTAYRSLGRLDDAWNQHVRVLAQLDSLPQTLRYGAIDDAAGTLVALGRLDAARALLTRERARPGLSVAAAGSLDERIARVLLRQDRAQEALPFALRADALAVQMGAADLRVSALAAAGRAWRALGARDSARLAFAQAAALWEAARQVPRDPEWRERRSQDGLEIVAERIDLALEVGGPVAVREAFDLLQRFKARTLLERMTGPGRDPLAGARAPVRAEELMASLAPGEVLLDFFVGPDSALVFAVDRAGLSMARLPPGPALTRRAELLRELFADPRNDAMHAALRERAAAAFGAALYRDVAARVRGARAVVLVPDGGLNRIPLEWLPVPGDERALAARRDVWRVPSATLLVALRARRGPPRGHGMLAVAGSRDDRGHPLAGAVREVRALGAHFGGVEIRVLGGPEGAPLALAELPRFDVLHVAAHTVVDDQRPWNSGVFLAAGGGRDVWLRAGEISAIPLAARLAVLAGCTSAGGLTRSGEGVRGLSAAFLSAGVPAVVVTLWPVDDRLAERFSTAFYARLARGEDAASALRSAQAAMRDQPLSARPFEWAGFVLVGEGTTRVALTARPPVGWWVVLGLALLPALGFGWRALVARRAPGKSGL